jgi:hypothetical protein
MLKYILTNVIAHVIFILTNDETNVKGNPETNKKERIILIPKNGLTHYIKYALTNCFQLV